ncbi:ORF1028 [White spot syndrome virus]|uniref:ORF1028 n=1 Tax=White spot syndrome virus TaxID=342409 RepID=A0A2D3I6I9_9VIRU|nr:ORF1028 [White spot syndrome virus]
MEISCLISNLSSYVPHDPLSVQFLILILLLLFLLSVPEMLNVLVVVAATSGTICLLVCCYDCYLQCLIHS